MAASTKQTVPTLEPSDFLHSATRATFLVSSTFEIEWLNDAAVEAFSACESGLQVKFALDADGVVGLSFLRFFDDMDHVKRVLKQKKSFPYQADVQLGGEAFSVEVHAVYKGRRITNYVVHWTAPATESAGTEFDATVRAMVDSMPLNVMLADLDFNIVYANATSLKTLGRLQEYLSVPVAQIVGSNIDVFHKELGEQRQLVADVDNLPHSDRVRLGPETFDVLVSPIYDASGAYAHAMVSWTTITEQIEIEKQNQALLKEQDRMAHDLRDRVDAILSVVNAACEGDLSLDVPIGGMDAVGQMGEGLQRFLNKLQSNMREIEQTSTSLAAAAEQLTVTGDVLGSNVQQTNSQADAVAGSVDLVSANVQAVASAAEEMTASISEIARNANKAAVVAQQAVVMAKETDDTINQLGTASTEIGEVIKVITSIAQQTNLLALNATIEAARAGDAGRGFAVVANEVKELAKETARATTDIGHKIEAIQGNTNRAVSAIRDIGGIIHQISEIQDSIASAVEEQSAVTNEISRSAVVAAASTTEISQSSGVVATAAERSQTAVGEVQGATGELARMASSLEQLVAQFNL